MIFTKRIVYNTGAQMVGRLISATCVFLTTVILARGLGIHYFGEFTKIMSYLVLFYVISDLGLNQVFLHATKDKAINRFPLFLGLRLSLALIFAIVSVLGMILLTRVSNGFILLTSLGVLLGSVSIVTYAMTLAITAIFQFRGRYDRAAIAQIAGSVGTLVWLGFFSVYLSGTAGVMVAVSAFVVGGLVSTTLCLWFIKGYIGLPKVNYQGSVWREWVIRSLPLGLTLIFNSFYLRMGTLILAAQRPALEVGAYGLAFKFFEFALALPTFYMNSYYPYLLQKPTLRSVRREIRSLIVILLLLSIVTAGVTWVGAGFLGLVKTDFIVSIPLLRALAVLIPIFFLSSPLMWFYIIHKRQTQLLFIYMVASVSCLVFNLLFIPKNGAVGAVWAIGITETIVLGWGWWKLLHDSYDPA